MDHEQALEIVRLLTDGIDPTTGEELPQDNPVQQPQVIRALGMAQRLLEVEHDRAKRRARLPEHTGQPWTPDEDRRLLAAFETAPDVAAIAAAHKRTRGAIRTRLMVLGKLTPLAS